METIALHESQAPYTVTLDEKTLRNDVTLLEQDGVPVAVLLPAKLYETFRVWQQRQQASPQSPQRVAFAQERAAFERLLPQLLQDHPSKVVAIYHGQVVEVGDEIGATLEKVYTRYGYVPCYVGRVEATQRVYKFPHRKVIR